MSEEERAKLKSQLLGQADSIGEKIRKCIDNEYNNEIDLSRFRTGYSDEERAQLRERISSRKSENVLMLAEINEWKAGFAKLCMAECKEVEKNLFRQIEIEEAQFRQQEQGRESQSKQQEAELKPQINQQKPEIETQGKQQQELESEIQRQKQEMQNHLSNLKNGLNVTNQAKVQLFAQVAAKIEMRYRPYTQNIREEIASVAAKTYSNFERAVKNANNRKEESDQKKETNAQVINILKTAEQQASKMLIGTGANVLDQAENKYFLSSVRAFVMDFALFADQQKLEQAINDSRNIGIFKRFIENVTGKTSKRKEKENDLEKLNNAISARRHELYINPVALDDSVTPEQVVQEMDACLREYQSNRSLQIHIERISKMRDAVGELYGIKKQDRPLPPATINRDVDLEMSFAFEHANDNLKKAQNIPLRKDLRYSPLDARVSQCVRSIKNELESMSTLVKPYIETKPNKDKETLGKIDNDDK